MPAELELINAVCKNKDIHVLLGVDTEVFGAYGDVVESLKSYYHKHRDVPGVEELVKRYGIEKVETYATSQHYLDEVKSGFLRGRMQKLFLDGAKRLEVDSPARVLEKLQEKVSALGRYTTSVRDLDLTDAEAAEEYFAKLRDLSEETGGIGIPTGFKSIDPFYPTGMAPGHSITILGYTGKMKSWFMLLLAIKAWSQGHKVMIMSLEMSPEEQRERAYALMASGIFDMRDLTRGTLNDDDWREFRESTLRNKSNFMVTSAEGLSEVTPNIIQAKIDVHKPDWVGLDYLQLMKDNAKTPAMTPRMLNLSREIKMLAVSNGIPVVSISAVTDDENDKRDGPPTLNQIAWSSGIEYDSNLAIAVHRHDDSNMVEISCRKNRHGELFGFYFEVNAGRGVWNELYELAS